MKRVIVGFLIVSFSLLIKSCDTTDPLDNKSLALKLEDVSCTEAWITLTTSNLQLPATLTLKQTDPTGNTKSQILNLNTKDSLLYIDSLLPNKSYSLIASHSGLSGISSNELSVTTMDTTSHNFTFQSWTFGTIGSSTLYDVAIINENNIWAVGEINIADTSINGYTTYNAVHWDGNQWELKRIKTNSCGGVEYPSIKTIFAFSANDILFAHIDGSITHYDGIEFTNDCSLITQLNGSANKMWGTSKNDFYVVSGNGFIARYLNGTWSRIESGTDVDIQDIWGISDGGSGSLILCAASNAIAPGEHKILGIINSAYVDTLPWISNKRVHSIWMDSKYQLFACGDGVFKNNSTNVWEEQDELTFIFTERIRGNSKNNLFVVGDFGFLAHYNGMSWKEYPEASAALVYTSLDIKNNLIVTVGYTQTKAVIQMFAKN